MPAIAETTSTVELRSIVTRLAREFDVGVVWLFGSAMEQGFEARDIDLAVDGIAPEKFFRFYARLMEELPKPVDLVDLSLEPPIRHLIWERGVRIYER